MGTSTAPSPVGEAFRPPFSSLDSVEYEPVRKRNRLPLQEYQGHKAYLLTIATAERAPFFTDEALVDYCLAELKAASRTAHFDVLAYCFMPDHLHLLVAGEAQESYLVNFVKSFKQRTGYWFRRQYQGGLKASPTGLWQRSYHDHVLRSDEALERAAEYVLNNPVEAGLVAEVGIYPHAGSLVWPHLNASSGLVEA